MNFENSPLLVIWEVTQACDQQCANCRTSLLAERDAAELTTAEAFRLLEEVRSFGNPLMVFTGGDLLKRPDLYELIGRSVGIGLRTNVTPSATKLLTDSAIDRFQECGVSRMAIGLDGPDAEMHDAIRQWPGSFDQALGALKRAQRIGLETQVQTVVNRKNRLLLSQIGERVFEVGAKLWSVFFSVEAGQRRRSERRGIRESLRDAVRALAPGAVRHPHYRRDPLPALRGPAAESGAYAARALADRSGGRRQGICVRVPHRRNFSQRILESVRRQRARTIDCGGLSQSRSVQDAARSGQAGREMRALRISPHLRRIAGPRLRADRKLPGGRSAVRVSAAGEIKEMERVQARSIFFTRGNRILFSR